MSNLAALSQAIFASSASTLAPTEEPAPRPNRVTKVLNPYTGATEEAEHQSAQLTEEQLGQLNAFFQQEHEAAQQAPPSSGRNVIQVKNPFTGKVEEVEASGTSLTKPQHAALIDFWRKEAADAQAATPKQPNVWRVTYTGPDGKKKTHDFNHKPGEKEIRRVGERLFPAPSLNMTAADLARGGRAKPDVLNNVQATVFGTPVPMPDGRPSSKEIAGRKPQFSFTLESPLSGMKSGGLSAQPLHVGQELPQVSGNASPVHDRLRATLGTLEEAMARAEREQPLTEGERAALKGAIQQYENGSVTDNLMRAKRGQISLYEAFRRDIGGIQTRITGEQETKQIREAAKGALSKAAVTYSHSSGIPQEVRRPVVNTALNLADPFTYRDQFEMAGSDPERFAREVIESYAAVLDKDASPEERIASALNWVLTVAPVLPKVKTLITGRAGAPSPKGIQAANNAAAAILRQTPETRALFDAELQGHTLRPGFENKAPHEQTLAEYRTSVIEQFRAQREAEIEAVRAQIPTMGKVEGRKLGHAVSVARKDLREYALSDAFLKESAQKHAAAVELAQQRGATIDPLVQRSNPQLGGKPKAAPTVEPATVTGTTPKAKATGFDHATATVEDYVRDYKAGKATTPEHEQFYANNADAVEAAFRKEAPPKTPQGEPDLSPLSPEEAARMVARLRGEEPPVAKTPSPKTSAAPEAPKATTQSAKQTKPEPITPEKRQAISDEVGKTGMFPAPDMNSPVAQVYEGMVLNGEPRGVETLHRAFDAYDAAHPPKGSAAAVTSTPESNLRQKIKDRANEARTRIKEHGPMAGRNAAPTGIDTELLADYAAIAADYLIDAAGDVAAVTKRLIEEYGLSPKVSSKVIARAHEYQASQRLETHFREGLANTPAGHPAASGLAILRQEFPGVPASRHKALVSEAKAAAGQPIATRTTSTGEQVPFIRRGVEIPQSLIDEAADFWVDPMLQPTKSELRIVTEAGKGSKQLHDFLIRERAEAVTNLTTERADWRQRMTTELPPIVRRNKRGSRAVMQYGEGRLTLEQLQTQFPKEWQQIVDADRWFRENYDALIDRWNAVREQYGFKPVPKRKDYYTHLREESLKARLLGKDSPLKHGGVAAESARLDKGFNPYELPRDGELPFKDDAVKAFEGYLNPVLRDIHLTGSAIRRRALADALRENSVTSAKLPEFISSLDAYADALVGKKQAIDRATPSGTLGRQATAFLNKHIDWLTQQQARNRIVGNVGSVLMQTTQLAPAVAETGLWRLSRGLAEEAAASVHGLPEAKTISPFLKRRYSNTSTIRPSGFEKTINVASYPLEAVEETMTTAIWRSAYHKAKDSGLQGAKAIEYADELTERMVAGRAIGEEPIVFNTRPGRVLGQFQLEVANAWHFFWKDLRHNPTGRKLPLHEQGYRYAKYAAAVYGLNTFYEWATGRTPLPDPIRMGEDIYKISSGHDSLRITRADTGKEKAVRIGGRIGGEFLSALPGGGLIADFAIPDYSAPLGVGMRREDFLGRTEAGIYAGSIPISSTIRNLFKDPAATAATTFLPFGGSQALRSTRGALSIAEGGVRNTADETERYHPAGSVGWWGDYLGTAKARKTGKGTGKSEFAFTIDSLPDKIRLILFGPRATDPGRALEEQENAKGSKGG